VIAEQGVGAPVCKAVKTINNCAPTEGANRMNEITADNARRVFTFSQLLALATVWAMDNPGGQGHALLEDNSGGYEVEVSSTRNGNLTFEARRNIEDQRDAFTGRWRTAGRFVRFYSVSEVNSNVA
jgi:hypothetical protein